MSGAALFTKNSGPLSVLLSVSYLFGDRFGSGTATTAETTTAIAVEGTAPFTYAWTRASGSTSIFANNPTAATTDFFSYFATPSARTATFICTVTDAVPTVVASSAVTIDLEAY